MKFSIIIPNYNSEKWTEKCLTSILNQTYKNFEIIFVDDMSADHSVAIAKRLLKKPHKIIQLKNKRLSGGTRNEGINNSSGDYIITIDSDDWLIDNHVLEDINNALNGEDIMYLGFKMLGAEETACILNSNDKLKAFNTPFAASWLKVVKKELYLKAPFPEGTLFEDRIQNYELVLNANSITSLGRITHTWNRTNINATTFSPKWGTYRFEYCGELYRLIQKTSDEQFKDILIKELNMYMNSINRMVGELNGNN